MSLENYPELLSYNDLKESLKLSRQSLHRWIDLGIFPEPIRIGPNRVAFRKEHILQWLDSRPVASE